MKNHPAWCALLAGALSLALAPSAWPQASLGKKGGDKPKGQQTAPKGRPETKPRSSPVGGKSEAPSVKPKQEPSRPPVAPRANPQEKPRPSAQGSSRQDAPDDDRSSSSGRRVGLGRPTRGERIDPVAPSGSGRVSPSNNNQIRTQRDRPVVVTNAPAVTTNRDIVVEADRENRSQGARTDRRYRNGYHHYDPDWCDNDFRYGFYQYGYYVGNCVPSPFYYYNHVPAYVNCSRISLGSLSWSACSTPYSWGRYDGYQRGRDRYLDDTVHEIQRAFQRGSARGLYDLVSNDGVVVDVDGSGRYRLPGEDFYEMFVDLVEGTRTLDYDIRRVYRDGDDATVVAKHTFRNPWGTQQQMRHTYGLERWRSGYVLTYFKSDRTYFD